MPIPLEVARAALTQAFDPVTEVPLAQLAETRDLHFDDATLIVVVAPVSPAKPEREATGRAIRAALQAAGAGAVEISWEGPAPGRAKAADDAAAGVANILLVMSGKGGVGKSTVASNLTMALHRAGYRVGLLDADMYGPSVPTMLGVAGRLNAIEVSPGVVRILPLDRFGVKLMSVGFMLDDPRSAVIWRGPMVQGALMQFFNDVHWGELDFLLVDLPPGTGDVALTLSQKVKATGAVVVTTPQEVALQDVYKSVAMCKKVNIPILGVVENMSYFDDPAGNRHRLFGEGGGQKIAEFAEAPLLGQLPLDPAARVWGDAGTPVVQAAPTSSIARAFAEIAERVVDRVAEANAAKQETGSLEIDRSGGKARVHLPITKG